MFSDEAQERVADKVHGLADVVDDVIPDPDELAKQIRKIVMEVINGDISKMPLPSCLNRLSKM